MTSVIKFPSELFLNIHEIRIYGAIIGLIIQTNHDQTEDQDIDFSTDRVTIFLKSP